MINEKQSKAIKSVQNGTIGEARTKSFLIDRFWILERSVDIEGADFIIQRRLEGQSILDDRPPRFGIIQSKFSQDHNTSHSLKKEYVVDINGKPHLEFFLIINVGHENNAKMYLLSAKDIVDNFNAHNDLFSLSTKKVGKFEVKNARKSLDLIENYIKCAEFYKNRMYVFNELNSKEPEFEAILPEYNMEIEYNDGNIPDLFKEQKQQAYEFIKKIESIHSQLIKFVVEIDPIEATYIAESFNHTNQNIIKIPIIFDQDFYYKARRYSQQINFLKEDGILENYFSLKEKIRTGVNNFLFSNIGDASLTTEHIVSIKYNPTDLSELSIQNEFNSVNDLYNKRYSRFLMSKEGEIKMSINIGANIKNNDLRPIINECCLRDLMEKIYEVKYFEIGNPSEEIV